MTDYCQWRDSNGICKQCILNKYLHEGTCVSKCPEGYISRQPNKMYGWRRYIGAVCQVKQNYQIVSTWGNSNYGGSNPNIPSNITNIFSTDYAFAALKPDGSISSWGSKDYNIYEINAPTDSGYVNVFSNDRAFAALKDDGSISAWGESDHGGSNAPSGSGYVKIFYTSSAFAALKADGSITVWGDLDYGGCNSGSGGGSTHTKYSCNPGSSGYVDIFSAYGAFAALKDDGSITDCLINKNGAS